MAEPRKHASAVTAVVERVLSEGFRQPIPCRRTYQAGPEVGPESSAVARSALFPFRRRVIFLIDAGLDRSDTDGKRAERFEGVVTNLSCLVRTIVGQAWLCRAGAYRRARNIPGIE